MKRTVLAAVLAVLAATLTVRADSKWKQLGTYDGNGGAIDMQFNEECTRVKIVCTAGPLVINTVVVREGARTSDHTLARQFNTGEEHEITFDAAIHLTGLRVSTGKGGRFEVYSRKGKVKQAGAARQDDWQEIAQLSAGGSVKETGGRAGSTQCRIRCISGPVIINTVVVREGGQTTPFTVARRLEAGQEQTLDLNGTRNVTGLRISDDGRGQYAIDLK